MKVFGQVCWICGDTIADGETGILFEPLSADALVGAVDRLQ